MAAVGAPSWYCHIGTVFEKSGSWVGRREGELGWVFRVTRVVTGCRDSCFESGKGWIGNVLSIGKYCREVTMDE